MRGKENELFFQVGNEPTGLFGQALSHYKRQNKPKPSEEDDLTCPEVIEVRAEDDSPEGVRAFLEPIVGRVRQLCEEHLQQKEAWLRERAELQRRIAVLENAVRRR